MKDTPSLYDTLVQVLRQHEKWLDVRHAKTLAWMIVGLIESSKIRLHCERHLAPAGIIKGSYASFESYHCTLQGSPIRIVESPSQQHVSRIKDPLSQFLKKGCIRGEYLQAVF